MNVFKISLAFLRVLPLLRIDGKAIKVKDKRISERNLTLSESSRLDNFIDQY